MGATLRFLPIGWLGEKDAVFMDLDTGNPSAFVQPNQNKRKTIIVFLLTKNSLEIPMQFV